MTVSPSNSTEAVATHSEREESLEQTSVDKVESNSGVDRDDASRTIDSNDSQSGEDSGYRDYSRVSPNACLGTPEDPNYWTRIKGESLPVKLNDILSNPKFEEIIAWMPHGRSWRVENFKRFQKEVMPHYFNTRNYSSFVRVVNSWGFRRISSGVDRNSYYHELFLRGLPHLHRRMQRRPPNFPKVRSAIEAEPNFYSISSEHPLPAPTNDSQNQSQNDSKDASYEIPKEEEKQGSTRNSFPEDVATSTRGVEEDSNEGCDILDTDGRSANQAIAVYEVEEPKSDEYIPQNPVVQHEPYVQRPRENIGISAPKSAASKARTNMAEHFRQRRLQLELDEIEHTIATLRERAEEIRCEMATPPSESSNRFNLGLPPVVVQTPAERYVRNIRLMPTSGDSQMRLCALAATAHHAQQAESARSP